VPLKSVTFISLVFLLTTEQGFAGTIQQACLKSHRGAGQRALCACIQDVADRTLSSRDQKLAARFLVDPDKAERARKSSRRSDEAFWGRYENFGEAAKFYCN
jgi:hypothetical protein